MEAVIAALTGIVGGAGLLALLQGKPPLPTEADFNKANDKLKNTPGDPDASLVVGKYLCFVQGDYKNGLPYLQMSSDKTLKTLADHEIAPLYADTAPKKVGMGDEWVIAAKNFKPLYRIFYERAANWYAAAWPDLDDVWKEKLRDRFHKAAGFPADWAKRGKGTDKAPGWDGFSDYWGSFIDPSFGYSGKTSLKILSPGKGNDTGTTGAHTLTYPAVAGKKYTFSALVYGDHNENGGFLELRFIDQAGKYFDGRRVAIPEDNPWWQKIGGDMEAPMGTARFDVNISGVVKTGVLFVDDVSVTTNSKELLKNGSFEER